MDDRDCILAGLDSLLEAFNNHDLDRIMNMVGENCFIDMPRGPKPYGSRHSGKENVRAALAGRCEGLPDVHYEGHGHYVDGSTGISKWTLTGTASDGQKIEVRGCDFYEFVDGQVVSKDAYWKIVD